MINEVLKGNSTLTSLNVKEIGKEAMMIIEAMKINSTLTELDVSGEKNVKEYKNNEANSKTK